MKFQPDQFGAAITGYGPGWIAVSGRPLHHSLVVRSSGEHADWGVAGFDALGPAAFEPLAEWRPQVLLFGSGDTTRFPRPEWTRSLVEAGIGVEAMSTPAACRTYNILAGEGRRVLAALLLPQAG